MSASRLSRPPSGVVSQIKGSQDGKVAVRKKLFFPFIGSCVSACRMRREGLMMTAGDRVFQ